MTRATVGANLSYRFAATRRFASKHLGAPRATWHIEVVGSRTH
jgi:hypothetical protein